MGLAERRLAEKIKTEQVPQFLAELQAAMGFAPEVEIDWPSFMNDDEYPLNRMQDNLFYNLVEAMKSIGRDAMGKEALADSIHKIVLKNVPATETAAVTLHDKTLTLAAVLAGGTYSSYGYSEIIGYLEPKL